MFDLPGAGAARVRRTSTSGDSKALQRMHADSSRQARDAVTEKLRGFAASCESARVLKLLSDASGRRRA